MEHKKALITGSSTGIGRETALQLARTGYDVAVHYNSSEEKALEVQREIEDLGQKSICIKADLSLMSELKKLFAQYEESFGEMHLFVNNAGVTKKDSPFLDCSEELWDSICSVDLKAPYFAAQYAAKNMIQHNIAGSIINITSVHQTLNLVNYSAYSMVKAGLEKFTRHAAMELAKYGIRMNSIAPGLIKVRNLGGFTGVEQMQISRTPLQKCGFPVDIAKSVLFLASDDASFITGANLTVDGGVSLPALLFNEYV